MIAMTIRAAALLASTAAICAAADPDPSEVLQRVAAKVLARDSRLPNYTCVETVNRAYYKPAASTLPRDCPILMVIRRHPSPDMVLQLFMTDRLRLDVTMAGRGEIYSWAGASKFDTAGIEPVVKVGPIGTGSFGALLAVVFAQDLHTFQFDGTIRPPESNLMQYSFGVGQKASHYQVKAGNAWVRTACRGTFQVDPATAEVVRLAIQTVDEPSATGDCQTSISTDLIPIRIGDGVFPLPRQEIRRFVSDTGEEVENVTTLSACREYRGESTIRFDSGPGSSAKLNGAGTPPAALPAGLPFTLELTQPIFPPAPRQATPSQHAWQAPCATRRAESSPQRGPPWKAVSYVWRATIRRPSAPFWCSIRGPSGSAAPGSRLRPRRTAVLCQVKTAGRPVWCLIPRNAMRP